MFAAAWAVRGGPTWFLAIVIEVGVIIRAVTVYVRGGEDSDEGALAGSRADERQKLLGQRSRALAGRVAVIAAFAGLTLAVAFRAKLVVAIRGHARRDRLRLSLRLGGLRRWVQRMMRTPGTRRAPRSASELLHVPVRQAHDWQSPSLKLGALAAARLSRYTR